MRSNYNWILKVIPIIILSSILGYALYQEKLSSQELSMELQKQADELRIQQKEQAEELQALEVEAGFYEKLSLGFDVNVLIVGDSIGAGAGGTGEKWFTMLENYLENEYDSNVFITNVSMGGNSSYAGYVRTMELEDNIEYDLAIICYGQNDSVDDFSLYYESIIRAIGNKYTKCSVISFLESSQKTYTEKMKMIQDLGEYYSIPIADTIGSFIDSGLSWDTTLEDGTHPSDEGHRLYFETIKDVIDTKVQGEEKYQQMPVTPVNRDVIKFDSFQYIPVEDFEQLDEVSFQITDVEIGKVFGIDHTDVSGENKIEYYVDEELLGTWETTFNSDFTQRHIHVLQENLAGDGIVKIVFGSEEEAEGFKGIVFSEF